MAIVKTTNQVLLLANFYFSKDNALTIINVPQKCSWNIIFFKKSLVLYILIKYYVPSMTETDCDYLSVRKQAAFENYLESSTIVPVRFL